jgi:hypothetical protein
MKQCSSSAVCNRSQGCPHAVPHEHNDYCADVCSFLIAEDKTTHQGFTKRGQSAENEFYHHGAYTQTTVKNGGPCQTVLVTTRERFVMKR